MAKYLVQGYKTTVSSIVDARKRAYKMMHSHPYGSSKDTCMIWEMWGQMKVGVAKVTWHPYMIGALAYYEFKNGKEDRMGWMDGQGRVDFTPRTRYV